MSPMSLREGAMRINKNRRRLLLLILLTAALLPIEAYLQDAKTPYDKETLLQVVKLKALSSREIIDYIQKRGIGFQMTEDIIAEFLSAGAQPSLIRAMRVYYKPIEIKEEIKPLPTKPVEEQQSKSTPSDKGKSSISNQPLDKPSPQPAPESTRTPAEKRAERIVTAPVVIDPRISGEWEATGLLNDPLDPRRSLTVSFRLKLVAEKITEDYAKVTGDFIDETGSYTINEGEWRHGRHLHFLIGEEQEIISIYANFQPGRLWGGIGMRVGNEGWRGKWEAKKKK